MAVLCLGHRIRVPRCGGARSWNIPSRAVTHECVRMRCDPQFNPTPLSVLNHPTPIMSSSARAEGADKYGLKSHENFGLYSEKLRSTAQDLVNALNAHKDEGHLGFRDEITRLNQIIEDVRDIL